MRKAENGRRKRGRERAGKSEKDGIERKGRKKAKTKERGRVQLYLLDIEDLRGAAEKDPLFPRCLALLDETRRERAQSAKHPGTRAAQIGAGLLLQCAAREALAGRLGDPELGRGSVCARRWDLPELLAALESGGPLLPLCYEIGEHGKPSWTIGGAGNLPRFNLSHSGDFVCLATSEREIGVDLQEHRSPRRPGAEGSAQSGARREGSREFPIAERFFAEPERDAVREATRTSPEAGAELFYRLWTRKEAYGKCTGTGIGASLSIDFTDLAAPHLAGYEFAEADAGSGTGGGGLWSCKVPPGYSLTICVDKAGGSGTVHEVNLDESS